MLRVAGSASVDMRISMPANQLCVYPDHATMSRSTEVLICNLCTQEWTIQGTLTRAAILW